MLSANRVCNCESESCFRLLVVYLTLARKLEVVLRITVMNSRMKPTGRLHLPFDHLDLYPSSISSVGGGSSGEVGSSGE